MKTRTGEAKRHRCRRERVGEQATDATEPHASADLIDRAACQIAQIQERWTCCAFARRVASGSNEDFSEHRRSGRSARGNAANLEAILKRLFMTLCAAMLISVGALPDSKSVAEIKRQILQRSDLTGKPGTVVVVSRVELKPGASVPLHTHPGDEFLHILDGGVVNVPGKPPIVFKDGQTVHFPRGKVHGGFTVAGTKSIKAITVHIVDKHAPISKPYKK